MIELTTQQFFALLGLSTLAGGGQLVLLAKILLRLGRVGARLDEHDRRLRILEGKPA